MAWALALLLLLLSYGAFTQAYAPASWASVVFLAFALARRAWAYVPAAALLVLMLPVARWYPAWVWQVPSAGFLLPFVLCALFCAPFRILRARFAWLTRGDIDQISWLLLALVVLVSAVALILWALWTDYLGVATRMLAPLRQAPLWFSLLVLVPGFTVANAAAEELVYRGVLQDALETDWGRMPAVVLCLQASAFAAAHFRGGFPNGKVGYAMFFIYALRLGGLRRRTRGMLAPYLAHVGADAVIGYTLLALVS
jgi:membrane protease YdiL (CAAX protease family)